MNINKKLVLDSIKLLLLPIIILIIHGFLSILNLYKSIWWMDIPMHFIGGLLIGGSYFLLLKIFQREKYLGDTHNFIYFTFVVSLVALTAVSWEFLEFFSDYLFHTTAQPSLANTVQDLFLGILGGIFGYLIQNYIQIKNK